MEGITGWTKYIHKNHPFISSPALQLIRGTCWDQLILTGVLAPIMTMGLRPMARG
jgi:isochorismate hydrolase